MRNEATNKVINHNFYPDKTIRLVVGPYCLFLCSVLSCQYAFAFAYFLTHFARKDYVLRIMRQITFCLHRTHCASVEQSHHCVALPYVDIICFDGPMAYFLLTLMRRRLQEARHCCCQFDHKIEIGKKKTDAKKTNIVFSVQDLIAFSCCMREGC